MQLLLFRAMLLGLIVFISACTFGKQTVPTPAPTTVPRVKTDLKVTGKILLVKAGNIWVWDNGSLKEMTKGGRDTQPSWSPDGTAIVYVKREDSRSDIMLSNTATGYVRALTNTRLWGSYSGWVFRPTWAPDGKKIAFLSDEGSYDLGLWLINPDGTGRTKIAYNSQGIAGYESPTWSPDGKQIALTGYRSGVSQIWSYTLANAKWQQLTKAGDGAYDSRWSPAGDKIAFAVREAGKHYIWLMDADGGNTKQLTSDGSARAPTWSYDGQYLAYLSEGGSSGFDIWVIKIEEADGQLVTSEPKQLTKGQDIDPGAGLSWLK